MVRSVVVATLILCFSLTAALGQTTERIAFDFVANRSLAHEERATGLLLRGGSPGFAKYVHFGRPRNAWRLRSVWENKSVAWASVQAPIEVPAHKAGAFSALLISLYSPVVQTMKIVQGSKASAAIPLTQGWQTATVTLAEPARLGENRLLLQFSKPTTVEKQKVGAAIAWVRLLAAPAPAGADEESHFSELSGAGIKLRDGTAVSYYLLIPRSARLKASGFAAPCQLNATFDSKSGSKTMPLAPGLPIDLAPWAEQTVRVRFSSNGCPELNVRTLALVQAAEAISAAAAPPPKNVVIWLSDSTRADKFTIYNPKTRVVTPNMTKFAARATQFDVAYVQGNESRVSHASLFTGLYPSQHKFIPANAKLAHDWVTIPELLKTSGRATAGFMGNGFIDAFWGFGEGWSVLKNHIHEGGGLKAEDLWHASKTWLTGHIARTHAAPLFLYVGTIDAHVSWRAHSPWLEKYDPAPYQGPFVKSCSDPQLEKVIKGQLTLTDRDRQRVLALYDSDISYNDDQFGQLLKFLEEQKLLEETMIIYTADHGEELWDHGKIGHGQSLHEELVHVPLVISYPPLFPAGKRVEQGVEIVDLLPTIAQAVGQPAPAAAQGESLIPVAQGHCGGYARPSVSSQYELAHTMRLGPYKLWVGGSGDTHFYDLISDPKQTTDAPAARVTERRFVSDAMGLWMAYQKEWKKTRWGVASNQKPEFAADLDLSRK